MRAGFDPRSDFLWDYHYTVYWKLTQRIYAAELDPTYTGTEADYDYAHRPASAQGDRADRADREDRQAADHDPRHATTACCRSPRTPTSTPRWLAAQTGLHTYQRVEAGNHVDGLVDAHPDQLVPLVPLLQQAI